MEGGCGFYLSKLEVGMKLVSLYLSGVQCYHAIITPADLHLLIS